ncbi:MAG: helix-turn-helix domain-containing protein [Candidatus Competibacteraceae bacterium]|nr:helix-turn-helix domain-containing protein [Candidatus Competibacteraceae bacterium]
MSHEPSADFNPPTESATPRAESLGAWLACTRASHGAEPRDAARRLGLNPILIQAIENDDFERLGPPVFVRGYLSRYARFLELPESEVLDRYRQQVDTSREPPPLKVVHPRRRQTQVRDLRGLLYLLVVIGVGWTAVQNLGDLNPSRLSAWWASGHRDSATQPASSPMAVTTQTQYPFQPKSAETTSEPTPPPPAPTASEPAPAPRPEPDPASAVAQLAPPAPAIRPEPAPAVSAVTLATTATVSATVANNGDSSALDARSDARLMLQFSEDCWVEVKDAQGKVLANGLMKANTTHAIAGPAPFTVTLGNAPAARIALDDRLVDTAIYLPRRGTVSRFTLTPAP